MSDISNTKTRRIKDWFDLQRIKLTKFVKDHKYVSTLIVTIIFAGLIAVIVSATDNDPYAGNIRVDGLETYVRADGPDGKVYSFSNFDLAVKYKINIDAESEEQVTRDVIIKATIPENVDAKWVLYGNQEMDQKLLEDGRTIEVTKYGVRTGEQSLTETRLNMYVGNLSNDFQFKPVINVYEATSESKGAVNTSDETNASVKIYSEQITLLPELVGGLPYKVSATQKNVPFGIKLGFAEGENQSIDSLKGKYFGTEKSLTLSAYQDGELIDLITDEKYGVYNEDVKKYFRKENNEILSNTYMGNSTTELSKVSSSPVCEPKTSSVMTITKPDVIYIAKGNVNYLNVISDSVTCSSTNASVTNCTLSGGDVNVSEPGYYYATYEAGDVSAKIKVLVVDVQEINYISNDENLPDDSLYETKYKFNESTKEFDEVNQINCHDNYALYKQSSSSEDIVYVYYKDAFFDLWESREVSIDSSCSVTPANESADYMRCSQELGTMSCAFSKPDKIDYNPFTTNVLTTYTNNYNYKLDIQNITSDGIVYKNNKFITIGTYYVTAISTIPTNAETTVSLSAGDGSNTATTSVKYTNQVSTGTHDDDLIITNSENKLLDENSTLAYGDEVLIKSTYSHGYDADSQKQITVLINLNDQIKLVNYSSDKAYLASKEASVTYVFTGEPDVTTSDFNDALSKINSGAVLEKIEYIVTLEPGESFDITFKGIVKNNQSGIISISDSLENQVRFNIKPFRLKTNVYINEKQDEEILIDGTTNARTTLSIYPFVESPALKLDSGIVGISGYTNIKVEVTLPEGVNYLKNDGYAAPATNQNNKLTYEVKNARINTWIDPIYIDVDFDFNLNSDSPLVISFVTTATDTKNSAISLTDTVTRTIRYNNNDELISKLAADSSKVFKNKEFNITSTIYNNSTEAVSKEVIIELPYSNKETSNYNNGYTLLFSDDTWQCTTEKDFVSATSWKACNSSNNDLFVAAKRTLSLDARELYTLTIKVSPANNKSKDKYTFVSHIDINDSQASIRKEISVEVTSPNVSGLVWNDFNEDGIKDEDEDGISGVELQLYNSSKEMVAAATSDNEGYYEISDIEEDGTYYVVANYDTNKYSLTDVRSDLYDRKIISSFNYVTGEEGSKTVRTDDILIDNNNINATDYNLGLRLNKIYTVKLSKTISKIITVNKLGIATTKDYGNVTFAKLDVKDINSQKITVIYDIEIENTGYYPGYVYSIKDYIPAGMTLSSDIKENEGWENYGDNIVINRNLASPNSEKGYLKAGDKIHLNIALDITSKEAGTFINYVSVEDDDMGIYKQGGNEDE